MQRKEKKERKEMYLELRLVKQYGTCDRCILLMLRLQRKREQKIRLEREVSKHVRVSHRKVKKKNIYIYIYIKDKAELEITYSPLSGEPKVRGCLSLTPPRVLLEGGASVGGHEVASLDLLADLSLAGSFLAGAKMFVTFTFFSQPGG